MAGFEDKDGFGASAPPARLGGATALIPGGAKEFRDGLVKQYHNGDASLVERLEREGRNDVMSLAVELLKEMVKETDHLLGNELMATQNGDLRDASIISFKRAEVLEKAIKAVQAKMRFERETSGFDLDSQAMIVVFRFFMMKVKEVFERMDIDVEMSDIFFRQLGEAMENWKKELREQIEASPGASGGV
jgi:hypothetical protein